MHYLPQLDRAGVEEATAQTYAHWGRGRTLAAHRERVFGQLAYAGPTFLRYAGLRDERGELVAALKHYTILLDGLAAEPVRTVGIGAVFTPEGQRGRGGASRLIERVLDEAREQGYGAAMLYSDIDPRFYVRLGFTLLPARNWFAPVSALPAEGALPARPALPADEAHLQHWYQGSFAAGQVRPHRDELRWRFFRWWNPPDTERVVGEGAGAGYISLGPVERDTLWVEEWAAPGIAPERLWATVRALAVERGCVNVGGWLRREQVGAMFHWTHRSESIPMVALLDERLSLTAPRIASAHFGSIDHF